MSERPTEHQLLVALACVEHLVGSDPGMVLALVVGMVALTVERHPDPDGAIIATAEMVHSLRRMRAERAPEVPR